MTNVVNKSPARIFHFNSAGYWYHYPEPVNIKKCLIIRQRVEAIASDNRWILIDQDDNLIDMDWYLNTLATRQGILLGTL